MFIDCLPFDVAQATRFAWIWLCLGILKGVCFGSWLICIQYEFEQVVSTTRKRQQQSKSSLISMLEVRPDTGFVPPMEWHFMVKTLVSLISILVFLFLFVPFGFFPVVPASGFLPAVLVSVRACVHTERNYCQTRFNKCEKFMKSEKYLSSHDLTKTICCIVARLAPNS